MTAMLTWPRWPISDDKTLERVRGVLDSGRWAISGPFVGEDAQEQKFAREFARYLGVPHCVTLDHGTSALIAALEALDLGYGDEVIVPGMTWVAPAIAVLTVNATPVVVDVDPDTFCMSPERVREAISPRTRALLPVHLYGCMANMDELLAIAREKGLLVVEDSAHSHGSEWRGKKAGTMGDIGIYSMQQGKVLTCGEGGAAVTSNATYADRLEMSTWNARRRLEPSLRKRGWMELVEADKRWGTNRCISEMQAAILLDALPRLDAQTDLRYRNARFLDEELGAIPGMKAVKRLPQITRQAMYGYIISVDAKRFGATAHALVKPLQELLGMSNFQVHAPYQPMSETSLYAPHVRRHALEPWYQKAVDLSAARLPVCHAGWENGIVFHHSVLLGDDGHMTAIRDAFRELHKKHAS